MADVLAKGVFHSSLIFDAWTPLCFFYFLKGCFGGYLFLGLAFVAKLLIGVFCRLINFTVIENWVSNGEK